MSSDSFKTVVRKGEAPENSQTFLTAVGNLRKFDPRCYQFYQGTLAKLDSSPSIQNLKKMNAKFRADLDQDTNNSICNFNLDIRRSDSTIITVGATLNQQHTPAEAIAKINNLIDGDVSRAQSMSPLTDFNIEAAKDFFKK